MADELYLESALRDRLGITDALMKKTRREVVGEMGSNPCRLVVIQGRSHVAYDRSVVEAIVQALSCKKTRAPDEIGLSDASLDELLSSALIQGVPCEIQGTEKLQSDEVVLKVKLITKNRLVLLAENPNGEGLDPVRLRVRDTNLFIHGMLVPGCRHIEGDLYEFAGRQPRSRGRW